MESLRSGMENLFGEGLFSHHYSLHFALGKNIYRITGIFELPPTLLKILVHRDGDI
jgi:hypothetical protein